jgi:hypothetical protein
MVVLKVGPWSVARTHLALVDLGAEEADEVGRLSLPC